MCALREDNANILYSDQAEWNNKKDKIQPYKWTVTFLTKGRFTYGAQSFCNPTKFRGPDATRDSLLPVLFLNWSGS